MLTSEQRAELDTAGWTRLPAVVPVDDVSAMADRIWAFYSERGIARHDRATWPAGLSSKNQGLQKAGVFQGFANVLTAGLLDDLLGPGAWSQSANWGPALITWPEPGPWQLTHTNWHLDVPARGDPSHLAEARLFGFVSGVEPRGGGTLVVEGSHELARRLVAGSPDRDAGRSSEVFGRLKRMSSWFAALGRPGPDRVQQFMIDGDEVDGVRVRVAELCGAPGDVVAMMPWTLHSFSMNCSPMPRFMVTHTVMLNDHRLGR